MTRFENDWERDLDRQLKAIPDRRAPATLLPRVLAAARQPAWLRRWNALPAGARLALTAAGGAAALALLRLEAAVAARLLAEAAGPWDAVWRALSLAATQSAGGGATRWWAWKGPLAAAAFAAMTACAAATVLAAVLLKASHGAVSRSHA